jgi:mannose-1-phosphate guanylyltransferase
MPIKNNVFPIIITSGSRLWPVSTKNVPWEYCDLNSTSTIFQNTLNRMKDRENYNSPILVGNIAHRNILEKEIKEFCFTARKVILETVDLGTAMACALAAFEIMSQDPEGIMVMMPPEKSINNEQALHNAIHDAVEIAHNKYIVCCGLQPNESETNYSYIETAEKMTHFKDAYVLNNLLERTNPEAAKDYPASGKHFWNSGIYICSAKFFIDSLSVNYPEIVLHAYRSWSCAKNEGLYKTILLEKNDCFSPLSIESAVISSKASTVMVKGDFDWVDTNTCLASHETNKINEQQDQDARTNSEDTNTNPNMNSYNDITSKFALINYKKKAKSQYKYIE